MKLAALVELFGPVTMIQYAEACGWALARAHARSGAPAEISGYLGKNDAFDKAIARFSIAYADQNERDYEVLRKAVKAGRVEVVMESE
jgi:NAD(P)H-dependent flavin oxidoreductase YrpB (nitropropane dioxygenase family)